MRVKERTASPTAGGRQKRVTEKVKQALGVAGRLLPSPWTYSYCYFLTVCCNYSRSALALAVLFHPSAFGCTQRHTHPFYFYNLQFLPLHVACVTLLLTPGTAAITAAAAAAAAAAWLRNPTETGCMTCRHSNSEQNRGKQ